MIMDDHGCTPLHIIAQNGNVKIAELLIKAGVNTNTKDKKGSTPLHYAAEAGNDDIMELLIRAGADKNK